MSSTDNDILKFMSGLPVIYDNVCLVKSPLLKDIAAEGEDKFYQYISFININKPAMDNKELEQLLSPLSDFEFLILLAHADKNNYETISAAFEFFTGDKPTFIASPPQIVLGDPKEERILNLENFDGFQELVKVACAMNSPKNDTIQFLPTDSPRVRALKEKMLKGRKEVAKLKKKQAQKNGEGGDLELSDLIGSLAIGSNSYNLTNVWNLTYYAFQDQLKRMGWHEEFNINTRASLAGAKLDKNKLSHWIKSMTF